MCDHCLRGRPSQCRERSLFVYSGVYPRLDGGQAEFVRVPAADRVLMMLDDAVSDEAAVFLGDVLPTGYGALQRAGTSLGDTVVVVGCGPVGLMAVLCATRLAASVIAVDTIPARRDLAEDLAARAVAPEGSAALADELTGGLGVDVVVGAAGSPGGLTQALGLVRGRGVVSVVGAHFEPDYPLDNGFMFEREVSLVFTIGDPFNDRSRLLDLMVNDVLESTVVVSPRMSCICLRPLRYSGGSQGDPHVLPVSTAVPKGSGRHRWPRRRGSDEAGRCAPRSIGGHCCGR